MGAGGDSPPAKLRRAQPTFVVFFATLARYEHLPICKAALDAAVHFEQVESNRGQTLRFPVRRFRRPLFMKYPG